RAAAAPIFGLAAVALVTLLMLLPLGLLDPSDSHPRVFSALQAACRIASGFVFVFIGSLAATITWRVRASYILVGVGILFHLYLRWLVPDSDSEAGSGVSVWAVLDLAVTIAGGLLAVAIRHFWGHEKTSGLSQ
ncbi:MAG: hypothetical protein NT154_19190, partial [Verrucomicrobia bacterium]|nr:hypothetical protein [Verrucomicrobiota bacterium]